MPGLLQRGVQFGHAPATACSAFSGAAGSLPVSNAIWARQRDDVSFDLLRKFWCELPTQARRELLRIDKQTLCDQAKKNLYCSRCHGLLLECYSQFVMYGKSLQQEFIGGSFPQKTTADVLADNESDDLQDPSVHPWGGLAATKDGMLTLLDCFICASSPDVIHKVFSSARQREHDRELLYPDACGGGGRGWISQGLANYGRVHGARETCALHTSRLSCDTLLDFWSALGDETRSALLHMKEDDFIERLMYRFDSKRFCRDCRRNVLREFKELKELKRLRKELYCTSWFCAADTAIQYEVSEDSVIVDWQHSFTNTSTYHHFEWAIGTAEGKGDILDFEDVGMNGKVEVKGLDLSSFSACFITLRAWKLDGRCTELSVKAHALNGQKCVHRRLVVSEGFVTITKGDSIKCFFEHAEEVEEEEDDDIDKDGIELDGDGSRPQKHAKSPELAREFLLDAATVIFKEQVEKAFREGTARQNSHSLFISLTIKLLEDCVYVACKEIITLEKQIKLLEEEENEKREEEERKERRRNKEREKKQRRKDRLREKEKDREMKLVEENPSCIDLSTSANTPLRSINDESLARTLNFGDSLSDPRDYKDVLEPNSTDMTDDTSVYEDVDTVNLQTDTACRLGYLEEVLHFRESAGSFLLKQSKSSRRKLPFKRSALQDQPPKWYDKHRSVFRNVMSIQESNMKLRASSRCLSGGSRPFMEKAGRMDSRNCTDVRICDKFRSSQGRILNTSDSLPCRSNHTGEYKLVMDQYHISSMKGRREVKSVKAADSTGSLPRQLSHYSKHIHGGYLPDNRMLSKAKLVPGASTRDSSHTRQVWEPMDARKKHNRTNLGADLSSIDTAEIHPSKETTFDKDERDLQSFDHEPSAEDNSPEFSRKTRKVDSSRFSENQLDQSQTKDSNNSDFKVLQSCQNGFPSSEKSLCCSKDVGEDDHNQSSTTISTNDCCHSSSMISSSSDSCSSCPSEGDSSASFSSRLNVETSSTSDSEDASLQLDQRDTSTCNGDTILKNQNCSPDIKFGSRGYPLEQTNTTSGLPPRANSPRDESIKFGYSSGISSNFNVVPSQHHMLYAHSHLPIPTFPSELIGYENQNTIYWSDNGQLPFSQHHYMFPTPVGYGLPRNRSSGFAIQYNTLQPVTAAVFNSGQLHSFHGISKDCRAYPASLNDNGYREQVTEMVEPKTKSSEIKDHSLIEGTRNGATKSNESNNSFSLFHFGGPLVDATASDAKTDCAKDDAGMKLKAVESLDATSCSMEETKVEEYSLFSTKNSSRFLFSSFTI